MNDAYQSLIPLMQLKSSLKDVRYFHNMVNTVFHDHESRLYDRIHHEMWASLPEQYHLIIADIHENLKGRHNLKLLDIGCGTGLAAHMLLDTSAGKHINEVHLLDTSAKMLKKAAVRSKSWNKQIRFIHGDVNCLGGTYDMIIISSVLHHVPNLDHFLREVSSRQAEGGILITIHDPAEEALSSTAYKQRCQDLWHYRQTAGNTSSKASIPKRLINKIRRMLYPENYMERVNSELIKKNIINEPLTGPEIWSITDIHVEALPYSASNGISKRFLSDTLKDYSLLSYRTYGFFGTLNSNLDPVYQQKENELIEKKDLHGRNFSSAWIKE